MAKPVITYLDQIALKSTDAVKIAYVDSNGIWECMTDPAVCVADDEKLSLVVTALDTKGKRNRYAIGINSDNLYVDFLRDEQ